MNLSKTKTKIGALFALCILTLLCLSLGSVLMAGADDMPVWDGADVQARYTSNRMLVLPKKTVTVGGKTETASAVVRFPDGTAKRIDSLFLEQTGRVYGFVYGKRRRQTVFRVVGISRGERQRVDGRKLDRRVGV